MRHYNFSSRAAIFKSRFELRLASSAVIKPLLKLKLVPLLSTAVSCLVGVGIQRVVQAVTSHTGRITIIG